MGQYHTPLPLILINREACCPSKEYKSFFKAVKGNEGSRCRYNLRLDTYGCGCQHNCRYCYSRSLLDFRGLWDANNPSIADINKIRKKVEKIPNGAIMRIGSMTDCFQPLELEHHVTYETIKELNKHGVGYLIVTKSHIVAEQDYMDILDRKLAHIQITVTSFDDRKALTYEQASVPSKRLKAIRRLQSAGFDVAIRLSPIIDEYMDYKKLNSLDIKKCIIEFLRVNFWIKRWLSGIDYTQYNLYQNNYYHLPLSEKIKIVNKIQISEKSVCEDVSEHFKYWQENVNPNKFDCCNLMDGS